MSVKIFFTPLSLPAQMQILVAPREALSQKRKTAMRISKKRMAVIRNKQIRRAGEPRC